MAVSTTAGTPTVNHINAGDVVATKAIAPTSQHTQNTANAVMNAHGRRRLSTTTPPVTWRTTMSSMPGEVVGAVLIAAF